MRHILKKLLCLLFLHPFETVDKEYPYQTEVCEQCSTTWIVDWKNHTMETLEEVT